MMINATFVIECALGFTLGALIVNLIDWRRQHRYERERAEYEAKKNGPLDPLDQLVQQERIKQAVPLVTLVAMNLPVDVVSVTLITHYADGCSLALDCGRPELVEAPKEF